MPVSVIHAAERLCSLSIYKIPTRRILKDYFLFYKAGHRIIEFFLICFLRLTKYPEKCCIRSDNGSQFMLGKMFGNIFGLDSCPTAKFTHVAHLRKTRI